ncbi:MAG: FAD-dependent oxidoreductase [Desulfobacterales bacterium]|nr:FAD-dependent oxidoreductase [Desulfobacterales bacterium]
MRNNKNRLRSVIVIGATPAGIAAVNKLGELGIPVTLVDKESDLDQKLSHSRYRLDSGITLNYANRPGLLRILRNPLISCILPATVDTIKHSTQGFSLSIRKHPTFVDPDRCTLCGNCVSACPLSDDSENPPVQIRTRMRLPGRVVIDKRRPPLCQETCPLGVNVQGYMALAKKGLFDEALSLIRENNVLPGICGRVCTHPCEDQCRRKDVDAPVSVREIKRFLADRQKLGPSKPEKTVPRKDGMHIAVIGSGPAGIAAAADLARKGVKVTIFEKEKQTGGLLRYGIGPHRLPRDIIDAELDQLTQMGVSIKTGRPIDLIHDLKALKKKHDALVLATGSWADRTLGIEGEDLKGVYGCLSFLADVYRNSITTFKGRAAVIGDGNAAFDLARVLKRLGADVTLISWFPKDMIPADMEEVEGAKTEGVKFLYDLQVTGFKGKGNKLSVVRAKATRPGPADANGIPWPVMVPRAKTKNLKFDTAFVAVGQKGAYAPSDTGKAVGATPHGFIKADAAGRTGLDRVYATGDAVTGASSVVDAMAHGRHVAATLLMDFSHRHDTRLKAAGLRPATRPVDKDFNPVPLDLKKEKRAEPMLADKKSRRMLHAEVSSGLSESQVKSEASRCLQCGVCAQCLECIDACGSINALRHHQTADAVKLHAGVVVVADPDQVPDIHGEDVVRTYGPKAAKPNVYAMITRGYASAAQALMLLGETATRPRGSGISFTPPDPGLSDEIRIGVFVCRCNDAQGWSDAFDQYINQLTKRDHVVHAQTINAACVPEGITDMVDTVKALGITRMVLASCVCCPLNFVCSACTDQRSRLKNGLFNGTGVSRSMVQTGNIRGEVLRLLKTSPHEAIRRFTGFMDRSIARAARLLPLPAPARNFNFTTAVIGGSAAAIASARTLARTGMDVFFFPQSAMVDDDIKKAANIHAFEGEMVTRISGTIGNFNIHVKGKDSERSLSVGGVILGHTAKGIRLYQPDLAGPTQRVEYEIQTKGVPGVPFVYPGTTSLTGLFLSDPPKVPISKNRKGQAAAVMAAAAMPRGPRHQRGYSVFIETDTCRGCGRCILVCSYQAISFKANNAGGQSAHVDEALCKGCGNCISVCPSGSADSLYRDQAYLEQTLEELLTV